MVDYFSKSCEAVPIPQQDALTVTRGFIDHWVSWYGSPFSLHSDQGSAFESHLVAQSMEYNPNFLESASNCAIKMLQITAGVIKWTALFWSPWAFRNPHTIGIRMTYVGCTWILNSLTFKARLDARSRLQMKYNIQRVGLSTREGEFVEAFYADRRIKSSSKSISPEQDDLNGEILVR
ncbi:unnamed protein product [Schistosoma curassoni]|uniref:Integrase catalytic domain-containing protein n=1 Tax=Schistosoma curassoni TaxID=6186 RepID=A0A183KQD9_9TREM|nr:unnamed protein product [Schistosoma curassoni]